MFGIGTGEIILILVIAMLVVGPERMVEFSRTAGTMLAKFRRETNAVTSEFKEALDIDPIMEAVNTTKEAATEVQEALKSTEEIAKGEMQDAQKAVQEATDTANATPIVPPSSAFADSQVSRPAVRSSSTVSSPQAATTLAAVETSDDSASGEDVYEVTELDGPELMDDVDATTTNRSIPSEV